MAYGKDVPSTSAAVNGGGGDNDDRRGWTLMDKGQEPVQQRRQARTLTGKGQVPAATTTADNSGC